MEQDAGLALLALKQQQIATQNRRSTPAAMANNTTTNNNNNGAVVEIIPQHKQHSVLILTDNGVTGVANNVLPSSLPPPGALARIDAEDVIYFVCKQKIVIGRESGHNPADVSLKENSFISRAHLELFYKKKNEENYADNADDDDEEESAAAGFWYFHCNGKNGIFVDDVLYRKGPSTAPLPSE